MSGRELRDLFVEVLRPIRLKRSIETPIKAIRGFRTTNWPKCHIGDLDGSEVLGRITVGIFISDVPAAGGAGRCAIAVVAFSKTVARKPILRASE